MRLLFVGFCFLWMTACATEGPADPSRPLDAEFVLAPGERAAIEGASMSVRFVEVSGDSRCPADAICILGGDAIVRVQAITAGGAQYPYELHTGNMRPATHGGY